MRIVPSVAKLLRGDDVDFLVNMIGEKWRLKEKNDVDILSDVLIHDVLSI